MSLTSSVILSDPKSNRLRTVSVVFILFSTWPSTEPDIDRDGCCVWGTSIEEVENQYEVKVLADELDCEVEDIRELVTAEYH